MMPRHKDNFTLPIVKCKKLAFIPSNVGKIHDRWQMKINIIDNLNTST